RRQRRGASGRRGKAGRSTRLERRARSPRRRSVRRQAPQALPGERHAKGARSLLSGAHFLETVPGTVFRFGTVFRRARTFVRVFACSREGIYLEARRDLDGTVAHG